MRSDRRAGRRGGRTSCLGRHLVPGAPVTPTVRALPSRTTTFAFGMTRRQEIGELTSDIGPGYLIGVPEQVIGREQGVCLAAPELSLQPETPEPLGFPTRRAPRLDEHALAGWRSDMSFAEHTRVEVVGWDRCRWRPEPGRLRIVTLVERAVGNIRAGLRDLEPRPKGHCVLLQ